MKMQRNESLDVISGIMIIWMVIYHIIDWAGLTDQNIYKIPLQWLFFFMPWFYFKSGMFHKIDNNILLNVVGRNFIKLITPLIIWTIIGVIVSIPEMVVFDRTALWKMLVKPIYFPLRYGDIFGNQPLWFLLSLFIVKIISFYSLKIKHQILMMLYIITLIISGAVLSEYSIRLPLGLHNVPLGLVFYFAGYYLRVKINFTNHGFLKTIFVFSIFALINYHMWSYVDVHLNAVKYGDYLSYIILSILAIFVYVNLFSYVKNNYFLSWIGRKSMVVLLLHWPILTIIRTCWRTFELEPKGYVFFYVLLFITFSAIYYLVYSLPEKFIYLNFTKNRL